MIPISIKALVKAILKDDDDDEEEEEGYDKAATADDRGMLKHKRQR